MIHSLIIDSAMDLRQLKKLTRKYAMTGGVEFELGSELAQENIPELIKELREDLMRYADEPLRRKTSTAFRVLDLFSQDERFSADFREGIRLLLDEGHDTKLLIANSPDTEI